MPQLQGAKPKERRRISHTSKKPTNLRRWTCFILHNILVLSETAAKKCPTAIWSMIWMNKWRKSHHGMAARKSKKSSEFLKRIRRPRFYNINNNNSSDEEAQESRQKENLPNKGRAYCRYWRIMARRRFDKTTFTKKLMIPSSRSKFGINALIASLIWIMIENNYLVGLLQQEIIKLQPEIGSALRRCSNRAWMLELQPKGASRTIRSQSRRSNSILAKFNSNSQIYQIPTFKAKACLHRNS